MALKPASAMHPPIFVLFLMLAHATFTCCLLYTSVRPTITPHASLKSNFHSMDDSRILHGFRQKEHKSRWRTTCQMNKVPNYFDIIRGETSEDDETEEQDATNTKRGVFRRIKERISRTFTEKNNNDKTETITPEDAGYKPSPLDSLRLKLALAMSNLSSPFQRSREEWVVACPKTRVGPGQIVPCVVNGLDIIIFASRDGKRLDAFANSCPHLGSPFDLATIERKPVVGDRGREDDGAGDGCVDCIVCPVHRTAFEIQSGDVRGEWCPYPPVLGGIMGYVKPKNGLVKFGVRLRGKNVEVRIATSLKNVNQGSEGDSTLRDIK